MARLKFIQALIICLFASTINAQTDSVINLTQQHFIQGSFTNFYVDNLASIYLLNADNQIRKFNSNGDSVAVANALRRYGDIYSMDVSNALKTLVYYRDFSTIVVLDRFLKTVNTIDLRKSGIQQARSVATSYDNSYWVFGEVENALKKIDDNGNLLLSSPDLRTVFGESFLPDKIIDYSGYVYLFNKTSGCKIFDYYGALKQTIPVLNWNNIQLYKNSIIGFTDANMHVYNIPLFIENKFVINGNMQDALKIQKLLNNLYVLKPDGLYIYAITN